MSETTAEPANMEDLSSWNTARSIGSGLFSCFKSQEQSFLELKEDWAEIEFPSRDDCLMAVMNSKGETKTERINSIARWVKTWGTENFESYLSENAYGRNSARYRQKSPKPSP